MCVINDLSRHRNLLVMLHVPITKSHSLDRSYVIPSVTYTHHLPLIRTDQRCLQLHKKVEFESASDLNSANYDLIFNPLASF